MATELLQENKKVGVNLGKRTYEDEMEELCTSYLIPLLKKHITDKTKTPLLIRGLNTFDNNGNTRRNELSDEDDDLNYLLFMECLSYTKDNTNLIISNLKEDTKIDLIVNQFGNIDFENQLKEELNNM